MLQTVGCTKSKHVVLCLCMVDLQHLLDEARCLCHNTIEMATRLSTKRWSADRGTEQPLQTTKGELHPTSLQSLNELVVVVRLASDPNMKFRHVGV